MITAVELKCKVALNCSGGKRHFPALSTLNTLSTFSSLYFRDISNRGLCNRVFAVWYLYLSKGSESFLLRCRRGINDCVSLFSLFHKQISSPATHKSHSQTVSDGGGGRFHVSRHLRAEISGSIQVSRRTCALKTRVPLCSRKRLLPPHFHEKKNSLKWSQTGKWSSS